MSNNTKQLIILGCLVFLGLAAVLLRCTGAPAPVPKRPVDTLAIHAAHLEAQAWKDSATSYKTRLDTSSDSVVVEEADHWYAVHDTLPVHDTVRRNDTVKLLEAVLADDSVCRAEGEGLRLVIGSTQDQLLAASQQAAACQDTLGKERVSTHWKAMGEGVLIGVPIGIVLRSMLP